MTDRRTDRQTDRRTDGIAIACALSHQILNKEAEDEFSGVTRNSGAPGQNNQAGPSPFLPLSSGGSTLGPVGKGPPNLAQAPKFLDTVVPLLVELIGSIVNSLKFRLAVVASQMMRGQAPNIFS